MVSNVTARHEQRGRILVITIDRPEKRNAINNDVTVAIDQALNELDDNPDLWAGVITGTPTMFSGVSRHSGTRV